MSKRPHFLFIGALSCATALIIPSVAMAQSAPSDARANGGDTVLETIVVQDANAIGPEKGVVASRTKAASKTDTPIIDAPAAVSVVTQDEIKNRSAGDLQQVIAYTSGVTVDEYGSDNRYDFFRIRGFGAQGNGVYRDGLPTRNINFTSARIEPYAYQRAEVLKGSTSTLYGLNAPGGLVNLVTKRPQDVAFGEVYTTLGEDHAEVGADFGGPIDDAGIWTYRLTTKGQNADIDNEYLPDDRRYVGLAIGFNPTDATSFTLLTNFNKREGNTGMSIPVGRGIDPRTYLGEPEWNDMDSIERNIGYEFEHDFGNGLTFRQNLRYGTLDMVYQQVYGTYTGADAEAGDRIAYGVDGYIERFGVDNQLEYQASFGRFDSKTLLGTDFVRDNARELTRRGRASKLEGDLSNPIYCGVSCVEIRTVTPSSIDQKSTGVYLQEELTFDDRWIFTFGGRYDHVDTLQYNGARYFDATDEALTGRVGVTYKFNPNLSVYANYSESFQPIGANRTTYVGEVNPMEGTQYEIGAKYQPEGMDALFTAALFDLTQTNVAYSIGNGLFSQAGEVNVRGLELEGKVALTDQMNLTAAYTFWDAEITKDATPANVGKVPQLTPRHSASLWVDYTIPDIADAGDLTFGLGARFTGKRFADNANAVPLSSNVVFDAMAKYQINEKTDLQLNVTNLFDREYISQLSVFDNTAFYGNGREVKLTLRRTW